MCMCVCVCGGGGGGGRRGTYIISVAFCPDSLERCVSRIEGTEQQTVGWRNGGRKKRIRELRGVDNTHEKIK